MNLKYYLRGLGLGILVTALILTIAGRNPQTMTDAEVKERAKELGMIENTVLVEKTEAVENTAEVVKDSKAEEQAEVNAGVKDDVPQNEPQRNEKLQEEETPKEDETLKEETLKEEATKEEAPKEDEKTKEEMAGEETPKENISDDPEKPDNFSQETTEEQQSGTVKEATSDAEQQNRTEAVTLTIVSGDSSYSVAKKLFELGVVPSVEQTDRFLCNNGYDRTIRTGVYTIEQDETLESIARRINGK